MKHSSAQLGMKLEMLVGRLYANAAVVYKRVLNHSEAKKDGLLAIL